MSSAPAGERTGELVLLNELGRDTYSLGVIESVLPAGWSGRRFKFLVRAATELPMEWLVAVRFVAKIDGQHRCCQISGRAFDDPTKIVAFAEVGEIVSPEDFDNDMALPGAVTVMAGSETRIFLAA
jgi:hypothetical protein